LGPVIVRWHPLPDEAAWSRRAPVSPACIIDCGPRRLARAKTEQVGPLRTTVAVSHRWKHAVDLRRA